MVCIKFVTHKTTEHEAVQDTTLVEARCRYQYVAEIFNVQYTTM